MKRLLLLTLLLAPLPAMALDKARLDAAAEAAQRNLPARFGAAVLDTGDGARWGFHADERFPFDSTHKAFACAALLASGKPLQTPVSITPADILEYAPITKTLIGKPATLGDMCAAALAVSDNTAANFVTEADGGPAGVTAFLRTLGDPTSRLDRTEPTLNEAAPGDPRDTTTPNAAVDDLDKLLLGDALKADQRARLNQWMQADRVAGQLLRAALPAGWTIADKTGSGGHGSRGIVAVITPPGRAPLVVAVYLTDTGASMNARNAAIASIGAALVAP